MRGKGEREGRREQHGNWGKWLISFISRSKDGIIYWSGHFIKCQHEVSHQVTNGCLLFMTHRPRGPVSPWQPFRLFVSRIASHVLSCLPLNPFSCIILYAIVKTPKNKFSTCCGSVASFSVGVIFRSRMKALNMKRENANAKKQTQIRMYKAIALKVKAKSILAIKWLLPLSWKEGLMPDW